MTQDVIDYITNKLESGEFAFYGDIHIGITCGQQKCDDCYIATRVGEGEGITCVQILGSLYTEEVYPERFL